MKVKAAKVTMGDKKRLKASSEDAAEDLGIDAILLADSFTTKFEPISLECPKVLLPLVNTPMINYTLAWLESEDVRNVYVVCCSHSRQIIDYLHNSKWVNIPKFSVTTIESRNCTSAGDALRLIYEQNVIHGDFILVNGDTVSNMKLKQAFQEHRDRKRMDKNAVMTMVIKQSKPSQLGTTNELIMAINPTTKELLLYEDDHKETVTLDKSFLTQNPCFTLQSDKQDCYIDICSPQVLSLFTDDFDYQHLRHDFVKGLLADELMGFKIFTHEIDSSCYAAQIDNFSCYDSVSKAIIQRWTYPFVPDVNFSTTKLGKNGVYRACNIKQSRSSKVGPFIYIGKETCIGDKTVISNSVVGDGCKIGSNVAIDGCYIWNNVTIEDGCKLRDAILCDGVVMKLGAVLEAGVVLSYKVVVGQGIVVPSCSKVSLLPQSDSYEELEYGDDSISGIIEDNNLENGDLINDCVVSDMGEDGCGFIWSMSEVDNQQESDTESDDDDDDDDEERDESRVFEKEVEKTFLRGVHKNVKDQYIYLEVQSLKLAYNMDLDKCAGALFYSMMKLALDTSKNSGKNNLLKKTIDVISEWGKLLKPFLRGIDHEIEVILKFEEMCLESMKEYAPLFMHVLHVLYEKEIIQEIAILKWADEKEGADESDKVFVKQSEIFLRFLLEAPEEED